MMWDQGDKETLLYEFYAKPMARKLTLLKRSAMPEKMRVSTFSAEILKRLKCMFFE